MLLLDEPFRHSTRDARRHQNELTRICAETTDRLRDHPRCDEAILLADKILLMTNGPERAPWSSTRCRRRPLHHPHYYRIRNHLVDFLVHRSKLLQEGSKQAAANDDQPRVVRPGLADDPLPPAPTEPQLRQVK